MCLIEQRLNIPGGGARGPVYSGGKNITGESFYTRKESLLICQETGTGDSILIEKESLIGRESLTDLGQEREKIHCRVLPGNRENLLGETKRTPQAFPPLQNCTDSFAAGKFLEQ